LQFSRDEVDKCATRQTGGSVTGLVYDVKTGHIETVVPSAPLRPDSAQ
jgi:hypothetical protein